jgi:tripartite-type tricarboxylate transporter receptor subunit TctC
MLPVGVAPDVLERIRESVYHVLKMPDVQQKMLAIGLEPTAGEREDAAADVRREIDYWKRTVQATGSRRRTEAHSTLRQKRLEDCH